LPDAPENQYLAGIANLRETTKWLVGGILTAAVGVLAGGPLTGLGALDIGPRLIAALAAAATALLILGYLLWKALGLVAADTISVADLADAMKGPNAAATHRVQTRLAGELPYGCNTFDELVAKSKEITADRSDGSDARYKALQKEIDALNPRLGFEYRREHFLRLRDSLFRFMPIAIVAVGIFAWAANPPPRRILSEKPTPTTISLTRQQAAALELEPGCLPTTDSAPLRFDAIVLEVAEGRTEFITLPTPRCPPIRLTRQDEVWFVPK
jgi:hypothetical protein